MGPVRATMFRQFRSVALIPIRSAETWPSNCMIDPARRMASRKSFSSRCRSALIPGLGPPQSGGSFIASGPCSGIPSASVPCSGMPDTASPL
jgi:hypothetical protein